MKQYTAAISLVFLFHTYAWCSEPQPKKEMFLDNGAIRLGVDLSSGGSIFYFAQSSTGRNLLNHFDRGRFIQQSYYGNRDGSRWWDQDWSWNPVQGGDYQGNPAKLLEYETTDNLIYVKSMPRHWASGEDITDAVMEQWISLKNGYAHIKYQFTFTGNQNHPPVHQEMPAVFVDYALPHLVFYQGDHPWKNEELTRVVPGWPNEYYERAEHWSAYVDDEDWGIGVYSPGTPEITCYRFEGEKGPQGGGCSYFAPIRTLAITSGIVLNYDIYLTIGSITDIRERFHAIHASGKDEGGS